MVGKTLGHYEILEPLGAGGMGEVYLAEDTRLERQVALKVLPAELAAEPERLDRLEREARSLAALNHPNIVTVYSVEESGGVRFLTMERVEGRTLDSAMTGRGMGLEKFFSIAVPLADAVATAHARGVIHRDLKPQNVMVAQDGQPKVLDFGLAKPARGEDEGVVTRLPTEDIEELTREGQLLGTTPYLSPEQLQGQQATRRSDIFALGVILYEMAAGRRPFGGKTTAETLGAILNDAPEPITELRPELPRHLDRIVSRCLEKDPERRFQTALDVRNELERLRDEVLSGTSPERALAVRARSPRLLLGGAAAFVVVALLAWLAFGWLGRSSAPGENTGAARVESVVALPTIVSGPEEDLFLADAIPSTLSEHLLDIDGLETRRPPSSDRFARLELGNDLSRTAEVYRVDAVLESRVTVQADRLQFSFSLSDPVSQELLWIYSNEGTRDDYPDLIRRAVQDLRLQVWPDTQPMTSVTGQRASTPAQLAWHAGVHHSNRYNNTRREVDFDRARYHLQRAWTLDEDFAAAAAELAWLYFLRIETGDSTAFDDAERWAQRAIDTDPGSGLGWTVKSMVAFFRRDQTHVDLRYALNAAAHDPNNARAHMSLALSVAFPGGSQRLGLAAARESTRIDPLYRGGGVGVVAYLAYIGRLQEAQEIADDLLDVEPDLVLMLPFKALAAVELDRIEETKRMLATIETAEREGLLAPGFADVLDARIALEEGTDGAEQQAIATARAAIATRNPYVLGYAMETLSHYLANHGREDAALDLMEETGGDPPYDMLVLDEDLDPLRSSNRFQAQLERSRRHFDVIHGILREAQREDRLPDYMETALAELEAELEARGVVLDR